MEITTGTGISLFCLACQLDVNTNLHNNGIYIARCCEDDGLYKIITSLYKANFSYTHASLLRYLCIHRTIHGLYFLLTILFNYLPFHTCTYISIHMHNSLILCSTVL